MFGNADFGGSLVALNPAAGYTCMGVVAIWRYDGSVPDKNHFR